MIVVGVDGSDESKVALRWALDEAALRGSPVRAVYAWHYPALVGGYGYAVPDEADAGALQSGAADVLGTAVADVVADAGTQVEIEKVVLQGGAAQALIDEARTADLLVVGSRGRGGFAGMLLGSVSQHCSHHAPCPLVIVRHEPK